MPGGGSAGPRAPWTVWAPSDAALCTVSTVAARLRNVLTCSECAAEAVLDLSVSSAERGVWKTGLPGCVDLRNGERDICSSSRLEGERSQSREIIWFRRDPARVETSIRSTSMLSGYRKDQRESTSAKTSVILAGRWSPCGQPAVAVSPAAVAAVVSSVTSRWLQSVSSWSQQLVIAAGHFSQSLKLITTAGHFSVTFRWSQQLVTAASDASDSLNQQQPPPALSSVQLFA